MSIYADTNYLTRLYLERPETDDAQELFRLHRAVLPITWILRLEVINSFQQAVFSGFGEESSHVPIEHAAACQQHFRDDLRDGVAFQLTDSPLAEVSRLFEEIAFRWTAKHGFRAYDILHVSSALALGCTAFWSFDKRATKLAKLEGLEIM
jgi:predicted nucleic acid-binding protein